MTEELQISPKSKPRLEDPLTVNRSSSEVDIPVMAINDLTEGAPPTQAANPSPPQQPPSVNISRTGQSGEWMSGLRPTPPLGDITYVDFQGRTGSSEFPAMPDQPSAKSPSSSTSPGRILRSYASAAFGFFKPSKTSSDIRSSGISSSAAEDMVISSPLQTVGNPSSSQLSASQSVPATWSQGSSQSKDIRSAFSLRKNLPKIPEDLDKDKEWRAEMKTKISPPMGIRQTRSVASINNTNNNNNNNTTTTSQHSASSEVLDLNRTRSHDHDSGYSGSPPSLPRGSLHTVLTSSPSNKSTTGGGEPSTSTTIFSPAVPTVVIKPPITPPPPGKGKAREQQQQELPPITPPNPPEIVINEHHFSKTSLPYTLSPSKQAEVPIEHQRQTPEIIRSKRARVKSLIEDSLSPTEIREMERWTNSEAGNPQTRSKARHVPGTGMEEHHGKTCCVVM